MSTDANIRIMIQKTLQLRRRGEPQWEAEREIAGFREEGTDLIILDRDNREIERCSVADYDGWIVRGHSETIRDVEAVSRR